MKIVIYLMLMGFIKAAEEGCKHKGQSIRPSHIITTDDCTESCYCPPESDGNTPPVCYPICPKKKELNCKIDEHKTIARTKAENPWNVETGCTCEVEQCSKFPGKNPQNCQEKCPSYKIQCGHNEERVEATVVINGCECKTVTCVGKTTPPPSQGGDDSGGGCFSENSFVRNELGNKVSMKDVQVGDRVLAVDSTGHPVYSEVIMMMHRSPNAIADDFVKINTANNKSITLTKYHLIPAMKNLKFFYSKDIKVDQSLNVFDENYKTFQIVKVASIERVRGKGYYAPLTNDGTIVVDDVYASCYASVPFHHLAHSTFSFYRNMYPYLGMSSKQISDMDELHWYPNMLRSLINGLNILQISL